MRIGLESVCLSLRLCMFVFVWLYLSFHGRLSHILVHHLPFPFLCLFILCILPCLSNCLSLFLSLYLSLSLCISLSLRVLSLSCLSVSLSMSLSRSLSLLSFYLSLSCLFFTTLCVSVAQPIFFNFHQQSYVPRFSQRIPYTP